MEVYAKGNGHLDLAQRLNINRAKSLAIGGSANSRIIRTTIKHSYQVTEPTLYIMGLTFVSRSELPILTEDNEQTSFEGRWCNPQNQEFANRFEHHWTKADSEKFVEFKLKTEVYSLLDRTEDLMYNILSAIHSLQARGHRVLVYQQADDSYQMYLGNPRLNLLSSTDCIINGFRWCAVGYQYEQGVEQTPQLGGIYIGPKTTPNHMRHPLPGEHNIVNEYLVKYINDHNII
jgi:hypothetical protein